MKILEEDLNNCLTDNGQSCLNEHANDVNQEGVIFSFIALMIYMILANVLLINLLIAMFRLAYTSTCSIH